MRHEPFASLEELLAPGTLSRLVEYPVSSVHRLPFVGGHSASGSSFLGIVTNDGQGPRFVVKLSSPACDWIVRGTADERGREVLVWTTGLLDRLPPEITHPVVACAYDGAGWAILMHDISDDLLPDPLGETPITEANHWHYLDALAALHATFWEQSEITDPALGYCSPWHRYTVLSEESGWREADHPNEVVRWIREGWNSFWMLVEPDVAALLRQLLADPALLCTAMARYPQTVIHGDPRGANLGITNGFPPRVVLIDWHLVGPGLPGVDLAWYLLSTGGKVNVSRATAISWYRERLALRLGSRFEERWWRPQLELSLLGEMLRSGWKFGWNIEHDPNDSVRTWAREGLAWWSEQAKDGARWL